MNENSFIVFFIEDTIDHMADEKLKFKLTANMNVFGDVFVGFGKDVTNYQAIRLFDLRE
jgi:hypothetical protein